MMLSCVIRALKNSCSFKCLDLSLLHYTSLKGELQHQNKLISSERLFKILQNETKIIKIRQTVLEIFNFKNQDLDTFPRLNNRKTENVVF